MVAPSLDQRRKYIIKYQDSDVTNFTIKPNEGNYSVIEPYLCSAIITSFLHINNNLISYDSSTSAAFNCTLDMLGLELEVHIPYNEAKSELSHAEIQQRMTEYLCFLAAFNYLHFSVNWRDVPIEFKYCHFKKDGNFMFTKTMPTYDFERQCFNLNGEDGTFFLTEGVNGCGVYAEMIFARNDPIIPLKISDYMFDHFKKTLGIDDRFRCLFEAILDDALSDINNRIVTQNFHTIFNDGRSAIH